MQSIITHLYHQLLDAFWPRECLGCGGEVGDDSSLVCEDCWAHLVPARGVETPKYVHQLYVGFSYDDHLRNIVHHFKFENSTQLAKPLGRLLVKRLITMGYGPTRGTIAPVPTHPSRRRERGYNPAQLLAGSVAETWGLQFDPSLAVRRLAGPHQSLLSKQERRKVQRDTFHVLPPDNPEDPLILMDDVIGTGTTINRMAQAARKAGWRRIDAICLCG